MLAMSALRTRRGPTNGVWFVIAVLAATTAMLGLGAGIASAHTDFASSNPTDGETLDEPVDLVVVTFTNPAEPAGEGFAALDATGVVRAPTSVETVDGRNFELRFDPPLAGGDIGIRWKVRAGDAHPIEGSFSFTVTAPLTTTAPTVPVDTTPSPSLAETAPPSTAGTATASTSTPDTTTPDTTPPVVSDTETSLEQFLEVSSTTPGTGLARVGRILGFLGAIIGIGALAFVGTTLRGRPSEIATSLNVVRGLGLLLAGGATIEYFGVMRLTEASFVDNVSTAAGFATVLRIAGGLALAFGTAGSITAVGARRRTAPSTLSAAVVEHEDVDTADSGDAGRQVVRWSRDVRSWPAYAGIGAIIISFWFDGHTVTKGFRPLHAVVNSVHLVAGSVWAAGIVMMSIVIWMRFRQGRPSHAHELGLRFSPIATVSLVAVAAAGLVMSVLVLDSFGDLTSTEWGQILLLKVGAVAVAAAAGAYNHFRLIPALDATPDDVELAVRMRSTVTAEAILLLFVIVVTAWLVAAMS